MALLGLFANQAALAIENSRVFGHLGQVLFAAAAQATKKEVFADLCGSWQKTRTTPDAELAELAASFSELAAAGPAERRAAAQMLGQFASYVRSRRKRG